MQASVVGLFTGLILGIALAFEGFGALIIVAALGVVGVVVAKVLEGEIDLGQYVKRQ